VVEPAQQLVSGGDVLALAMPLGPPQRPVGYAILGRSLAPENDALSRVLGIFTLGAILALLLAAVVALPIINTALRPLRTVTRTAERIAGGDLEARTQLNRSPDEVGRLSEAFDRMVDQLQSAMQATAASEERMRRFLADASHELRTPATVLRGSSQVLLRHARGTSPETVSALREMHEEAVRLSTLIEDLLTLSRLDEGQLPEPEPVQLRTFVQHFLNRYASLWPDRDIAIEEAALDGATAAVNPESLRRIVTNLVDNAARYSRPGGHIRIGGSSADGRVSLCIADEGPGLPADEAARMFDRFYRSSRSRSRGSGGTGLGLAIVHGLVEGSGGTISVATAPDRGTTVTVELPAVPKGEGGSVKK
jgi:two-component system OmpR family sensor kinase